MKRPSSIQVAIFDQRGEGKLCLEGCGADWCSPEVQQEAEERLRQLHGGEVSIEFFNLEDPGMRAWNPKVVARIQDEGLLLPLLMINGEVRITGHFDIRQLVDAVEAQKELDIA
ncbi:MAG: hypothetical protein ACE5IA_00825 [Dehalococcoidia bacterium]